MKKPVSIFFCYAQKDKASLEELESHLDSLKRSEQIVTWHSGHIPPGMSWRSQIDEHLNASDLILALVSPDFMTSEYCYAIEIKRAMERYKSGDAWVVPIILRPVDLEETDLYEIQALPTDKKPISTWQHRDEAFLDVIQGIKKIIRVIPFEKLVREGDGHFYAKRYEAALVAYSEALQFGVDSIDLKMKRGSIFLSLGYYEEALDVYEQLLQIDKVNPDFHIKKSFALFCLERYTDALKICNRAIQLDPNNADFYAKKGAILFQLYRYKAALGAYDKALRLGADKEALSKERADVERAKVLSKERADVLKKRADALYFLERYDEVLEICDHLIRLSPNQASLYISRSLVLTRLGRHNEALNTCQRGLRLDPYNADAYLRLCYILYYLGRVEEAKKAYKQAFKIGLSTSTPGKSRTIW